MLAKQITNREQFLAIVAQATADAHRNCKTESDRNRWIRAIAKAAAQIETNGEFMHYDERENYLLIWSQESGEIYSANGVCGCEAFKRGFPCFHRAGARIFRIYFGMAENKSSLLPNNRRAVSANILPADSIRISLEASRRNAEMDNALYITPPSRAKYEKVEGFDL